MAVSKRLRYEVLRRDNHACRYCGVAAPVAVLTVDHVVPIALGGSDESSNLVAACADCNAGKSAGAPDTPVVEDVAEDALRWSRAMAQAAEIQAVRAGAVRSYCQQFYTFWEQWGGKTDFAEMCLPGDWASTAERWFIADVPLDEACRAADIALSNRRVGIGSVWRYACGVVWRQLDERQNLAREILATKAPEPEPEPEPEPSFSVVSKELIRELFGEAAARRQEAMGRADVED